MNYPIISVNAGEMTPQVDARSDVAKYSSGCRTMQNMIPRIYGGATRRPGTKYIYTAKSGSVKMKMVDFQYSDTITYGVELGDQYFRFYYDGAILTGLTRTEDLSALGNIIGHWKLNDRLPTDVVLDADGATHNGTASTNTDALSVLDDSGNYCFDLDGTYAVEMADHNDFSCNDSADGKLSIAAWAYVTKTGAMQVIMSKWDETTGSIQREWRLGLDSSRYLQLHLNDESTDLTGAVEAQYYLNDSASNTHIDDVTTFHDGVATNQDTDQITATGKVNACIDFAGTEAVEIDDHDDLSFGDGSTDKPFSIAAWVFFTGSTLYQTILAKYQGTSKREWMLNLDSYGNLLFALIDQSSNGFLFKLTDDALTTGWHLVVATYDGSGTTAGMTLYVDNIVVDQTASSYGTYTAMENTDVKMTISCRYDPAGTKIQYFQDKLDNITLFKIELSSGQVADLWNNGDGTEALTSGGSCHRKTDSPLTIGWHHIVATYDSSGATWTGKTAANFITFYVDGAVVDSTAFNGASYTAMENGTAIPRIGAQESSAGAIEAIWADKIDNVSMFSDILSASEVLALYSDTYEIEIVTPYLEADLYDLDFEQSADVMWITHNDYAPRKLTRTSATSFSLDIIPFTKGPFLERNDIANDDDVTMACSVVAKDATGTLTASAATFESGHTGALFKLTHPKNAANIAEKLTKTSASGSSTGIAIKGTFKFTVQGEWAGTAILQRFVTGETDYENYRTFVSRNKAIPRTVQWSGVEEDDNISYRINLTESGGGEATAELTSDESTRDGIVRIDSVTSPTVANITVLVALDSVDGTDTTKRWYEGAWSAVRGYPTSFTFFEERGVYAGTSYNLLTVWLSESGDYEDFEEGTNDSDSFSRILPSTNAIRWLKSLDVLLAGTVGGEWLIGPQTLGDILTPLNCTVKQQTTYGSSKVQPMKVNDAILFVDYVSRKIREMVFQNDPKYKFVAPDLTALAEHITKGGISSIAYQKSPDSIVWATLTTPFTRADDSVISLISMVYERDQDVVAWSAHPLGGDGIAESVIVIPSTTEDEVWLSVKRTINESTVRYIEQMQPRDWGTDDEDIFFVDSGLTYDGDATSTITGLTHLIGETVQVLGNGAKFADEIVDSNGEITLVETVTKAHVGLSYEYKLKPMRFDLVTQAGTARGSIKKIYEIVVSFYKTLNAQFGDGTDTRSFDWRTDEPYGSPPNLYTGDKKDSFDGGFSAEDPVVISGSDPFPCTVISIVPRVNITGR